MTFAISDAKFIFLQRKNIIKTIMSKIFDYQSLQFFVKYLLVVILFISHKYGSLVDLNDRHCMTLCCFSLVKTPLLIEIHSYCYRLTIYFHILSFILIIFYTICIQKYVKISIWFIDRFSTKIAKLTHFLSQLTNYCIVIIAQKIKFRN